MKVLPFEPGANSRTPLLGCSRGKAAECCSEKGGIHPKTPGLSIAFSGRLVPVEAFWLLLLRAAQEPDSIKHPGEIPQKPDDDRAMTCCTGTPLQRALSFSQEDSR
jgi:hypothetical protein